MKNRRTWWFVGTGIFLLTIILVAFAAMSHSNTLVIKDPHATAIGISNATTSAPGAASSTNVGGTSMDGNSDPITVPNQVADEAVLASSSPLIPLTMAEQAAYDAKMFAIANLPVVSKTLRVSSTIINPTTGTSSIVFHNVIVTSTAVTGWPVKSAPYPDEGALLPSHRIVAYYGNLYSTAMGVLAGDSRFGLYRRYGARESGRGWDVSRSNAGFASAANFVDGHASEWFGFFRCASRLK
jgi:hypothetical protein